MYGMFEPLDFRRSRHLTAIHGGQMPGATITDARVIAAILAHLETRTARAQPPLRH